MKISTEDKLTGVIEGLSSTCYELIEAFDLR
jgi:hypothetical protein